MSLSEDGAQMKNCKINRMRSRSLGVAILVSVFLLGCGREQVPSPAAPLVVSSVPANGATGVPIAQVITASFNEAMNAATINTSTFTVTGPGGASVTGTVTYSGTTATFTPSAALAPSTLYSGTITTGAAGPAGNHLAGNFVWSFTTGTIPTVTSTNPANGAVTVTLNRKLLATFSEAMNPATVTAQGTFTLKVAGPGGAAALGTVTYTAGSNSATFAPTVNLLPSTQYTATISTAAQSAAGNLLASNYVWSFTTGTTPDVTSPTVTVTKPVSGAAGVPTNQTITATFSELMDPATITAAGTFTVAVAGPGGAAVSGTVSYAGSIATFTPTANLTPNTQYTATITTAAKDLAGNALIAGAVPNPWSFTTGAAPDVTAPTITLTLPANADINVLLNQTVNATFSEAMNPATITAPGTFTLAVAGPGGAAVAGSVTYDSVNDIATFTPAANLTSGTQYTATITNAAQDLAGNALAAGVVPNPWSFTTGASLGPAAPNLGTASTFGAIGGSAGVTNEGTNTVINGDIGTTGASTTVTGFHDAGPGCTYIETGSNMGTVNGLIFTAAPPPTVGCPSEGTGTTAAIATQALSDANTAFINLSPASLPGGTDPGAGQLGGLTLAPGIYQAALGSFLITGSDLTLDAQGDTNAVWVFQMASSLTVGGPGAPRNIILAGGAQAKNVFWQVGSMATINGAGGGTMVGTIIASSGVTFSTAGNAAVTTLNGRALSLNASVTMVNTVINVPAP
jgi:Ice-binding-like/Bacterial Ig-like domain